MQKEKIGTFSNTVTWWKKIEIFEIGKPAFFLNFFIRKCIFTHIMYKQWVSICNSEAMTTKIARLNISIIMDINVARLNNDCINLTI